VTLHEKLTRLFIPDILVRTGAGEGGTRTGLLLREYPNGDLELEVRPGVIDRIKGTDVHREAPHPRRHPALSRRPLIRR
jgi:hypothetical protein